MPSLIKFIAAYIHTAAFDCKAIAATLARVFASQNDAWALKLFALSPPGRWRGSAPGIWPLQQIR
jgi:hypothetical protein